MSATPQELIVHVRTKIAGYKAPRDIDVVVELPKTSTGKIQKFVLRDSEWAGRTHHVPVSRVIRSRALLARGGRQRHGNDSRLR